MKNFFLTGLTALAVVVFMGSSVLITDSQAAEPEVINVEPIELVVEDAENNVATVAAQTGTTIKSYSFPGGPHFIAGDSVLISDDLEGDVYVAGGIVNLGGAVTGDVLAAGGNILISGDIENDVRVAGGNVTISGNVGRNITVLGGNVTITESSNVGNSVIVAGGSLNIDGQITDNLLAAGGAVIINGSVGQDVRVESATVTVGSAASISGNLVANYESESNVAPEASIAGTIATTQVDRATFNAGQTKVDSEDVAGAFAKAKAASLFFSILIGLVSGGVLFYLFKTQVLELTKIVEKAVFTSLGWGLVYLLVAPILAIFLMVTVVGLPLGLFTILFWIVDLIIAGWITAYVLGRWIHKKYSHKYLASDYTQFAVGLVVLQIIYLLPLVGGLARLIAVLIGMGAILIWSKNLLNPAGK